MSLREGESRDISSTNCDGMIKYHQFWFAEIFTIEK